MSLLADIVKSKRKSWTSTSNFGHNFCDSSWAAGIIIDCSKLIFFLILCVGALIVYTIYNGEITYASPFVSNYKSGDLKSINNVSTKNEPLLESFSFSSFQDVTQRKWIFLRKDKTTYRSLSTKINSDEIDISKARTISNNIVLANHMSHKINMTESAESETKEYVISYIDATANNPPPSLDTTVSGNEITLSSIIPKKDGFIFAGWCTKKVVSPEDASCSSGSILQPGGKYTVSTTTSIPIFAMWRRPSFDDAFAAAGKSKLGDYYKMEDMSTSICDSVYTGQVGTLVDNRGTSGIQTYTVAKLKDGKCWMTQNLRLTYTTSPIVVSDGAGGTVNWSPERATNTAWTEDYYNPYSYNLNDTTNGVYYNWTAAIASNDSSSYTSYGGIVNTSICPRGWKLPENKEVSGSWYAVDRDYDLFSSPVNIVVAGQYYSGGLVNVGADAVFWSNMSYSSTHAYGMYIYYVYPTPLDYNTRSYGRSVRCVSI